jgi:hypothetical protein
VPRPTRGRAIWHRRLNLAMRVNGVNGALSRARARRLSTRPR